MKELISIFWWIHWIILILYNVLSNESILDWWLSLWTPTLVNDEFKCNIACSFRKELLFFLFVVLRNLLTDQGSTINNHWQRFYTWIVSINYCEVFWGISENSITRKRIKTAQVDLKRTIYVTLLLVHGLPSYGVLLKTCSQSNNFILSYWFLSYWIKYSHKTHLGIRNNVVFCQYLYSIKFY